MKHYLPTIVEPYETEDGFLVSEINTIETTRHDLRIEAVINGKRQNYIAGRKSDLAAEIIACSVTAKWLLTLPDVLLSTPVLFLLLLILRTKTVTVLLLSLIHIFYAPILPWNAKKHFAVTAVDRYGNESTAAQK